MFLSNQELQEANKILKAQQRSMVKTEKLAAMGILSAGVAHEINNPLSFIKSNLNTLQQYYFDYYKKFLVEMSQQESSRELMEKILDGQDLDFIEKRYRADL